MGAITRLSIDLPDDLAEAVRERVESGQYASASEVVQEGLRALAERDEPEFDEEVEQWLRTEVVAAYDRVKEGVSRTYTPEEVEAALAEEHERATRRPCTSSAAPVQRIGSIGTATDCCDRIVEVHK